MCVCRKIADKKQAQRQGFVTWSLTVVLARPDAALLDRAAGVWCGAVDVGWSFPAVKRSNLILATSCRTPIAENSLTNKLSRRKFPRDISEPSCPRSEGRDREKEMKQRNEKKSSSILTETHSVRNVTLLLDPYRRVEKLRNYYFTDLMKRATCINVRTATSLPTVPPAPLRGHAAHGLLDHTACSTTKPGQ